MSTTILTPSAEGTTGWTLEMTGHADDLVCAAIKPDGQIIGIVHHSVYAEMPWSISAVPGLPTAHFRSNDDAVAWLTHLANRSTVVA